MSTNNTSNTLNSLFKEMYADKLEDILLGSFTHESYIHQDKHIKRYWGEETYTIDPKMRNFDSIESAVQFIDDFLLTL